MESLKTKERERENNKVVSKVQRNKIEEKGTKWYYSKSIMYFLSTGELIVPMSLYLEYYDSFQ